MTFDALTFYGLVSVSLMLLFYAFEDNSPWCILGFAIACLMGSVYGFLQGACVAIRSGRGHMGLYRS